jgi:hypothetical protein
MLEAGATAKKGRLASASSTHRSSPQQKPRCRTAIGWAGCSVPVSCGYSVPVVVRGTLGLLSISWPILWFCARDRQMSKAPWKLRKSGYKLPVLVDEKAILDGFGASVQICAFMGKAASHKPQALVYYTCSSTRSSITDTGVTEEKGVRVLVRRKGGAAGSTQLQMKLLFQARHPTDIGINIYARLVYPHYPGVSSGSKPGAATVHWYGKRAVKVWFSASWLELPAKYSIWSPHGETRTHTGMTMRSTRILHKDGRKVKVSR